MYVCTTFVVNKRIHIIPYHFLVRAFICFYLLFLLQKLEIRSVDRGICPIAKSTMTELFL